MIQMDYDFFDVESIYGFTTKLTSVCSIKSYLIDFPTRSKLPPLEVILFIFIIIQKQKNKVADIRLYEYIAHDNLTEFMNTRHCSILCSFDITRGSSLVFTHRTEDVRVTSDRPGTP